MFYYVYILKSSKDNKLYIGRTDNLIKRVEQHNQGRVRSTKARRPLVLIYYEAFKTKELSVKEELFLKSGIGKESLKHRLGL